MRRLLHMLLLFLLVSFPFSASSQNVNHATAIEWCVSVEESRDRRIRGCTVLIQSGRLNGEQLSEALMRRAGVFVEQEQISESISDLTKAIAASPSSFLPRMFLALIHVDQSRPEEALRIFGEATVPKDPNQLNFFYLTQGAILYANDYAADAVQLISKFLVANPNNLQVRVSRGEIYLSLDDPRASEDFMYVSKSSAKSTADFVSRAIALYKLERYHEAQDDLSVALARDPSNSSALLQRAIIGVKIGDSASATNDLDAVIRAKPRSALAHYYRCLLNYKQGDMSIALRDCSTAILLDPRYADALVLRGLVRLALKDNNGIVDIDNARRFRAERKTRRFFVN